MRAISANVPRLPASAAERRRYLTTPDRRSSQTCTAAYLAYCLSSDCAHSSILG
eukprot:IDg19473t1